MSGGMGAGAGMRMKGGDGMGAFAEERHERRQL